ncbi:MAG: glutamine synthetase [Solirubrobacterales bacterium]|nr:glutamine synthetase [Solirubrobacterales bacterium]MBV9534473.1 glutamine synthetase [Solirubrobacterales bacterium]
MATAEEQSVTVEDVLAGWREQGVRRVRFELPDMHGNSRSKLVPIEHAGQYAEEGLNMYGGAVVLDTRSDIVPGTLYNEEIGYADQRLTPDPSTAAIVPWAMHTGRMICDTYWDDGRPLGAAPRHVFRRVLDRCRELGYEPLIGIEPEFYLLDGDTKQPLFEGYHIFNTIRNTWVPAIERIVDEARTFGIDVLTANCEYAGSQWEIVFGPSSGMAGPDTAFSFKNAAKELAHQEGLIATFMSKPFTDSAGCGAHNHIALLERDGGANAMSDANAQWGLSKVGRSFVAGQLRHARSIYTLLAPTLNCLKRRRTHTFSPTNVSWGLEDRSALVRIKGGSAKSRHVENRAPTGLSNPYLASAALLGTGVLGVAEELDLEPPAAPPAEEDASKPPLPTTVQESLSLLENDERIVELLGPEFVTAYTVMRRHELQRFADHVTDWELEEYLELY